MTPHPALLAAGFVLLAAADWQPYTLSLVYRDHTETVAATSAEACNAAADAIAAGRWLADDPPVATRCSAENSFKPGWDCIASFNCPGSRR